ARSLHAPHGGRQHLGGAIRRDHGLRSDRQGGAVRAGGGQGLSPSERLCGARRGEEPVSATSTVSREALFDYVLRLADTALILGQQNARWCGHAPILEEDMAI